jgi:hypothetical protein
VPTADPPSDPSAPEDGRLDELAAHHGVTIGEVRRMMGPPEIERPNATVVDTDEVVRPSHVGPLNTTAEEPAVLGNDRLEELAASLGVTVDDVRRMVELAPPRTYRGRLDVDEIRRRYEAGESLAEIGAAMGASDTTVRNAMVRAGIPTRPGPVQQASGVVHCIGSTSRRSGGDGRRARRSRRSPGPSGPARAGSGG